MIFSSMRKAARSIIQRLHYSARLNPAHTSTFAQEIIPRSLCSAIPNSTLIDFPSGTPTGELVHELTFTDPYIGTWQRQAGGGSFYLTDPTERRTAAVINISLRTQVGSGRPAIVGFVIPGVPFQSTNSTDLLIRVVGPSLAQFGVADVWTDPDFALALGPSNSNVHLGDWSISPGAALAITKLSNYVGAFPLMAGAKDAVSVVRVMPGAYTITCGPTPSDNGGEVLIEVYTLP